MSGSSSQSKIRIRRENSTHPPSMGAFCIKYVPRRASEAPPTIVTQGRGLCGPGDGLRDYYIPPDEHGTQYCIHSDNAPASVRVSHGQVGAPVVEGWIAFERVLRP